MVVVAVEIPQVVAGVVVVVPEAVRPTRRVVGVLALAVVGEVAQVVAAAHRPVAAVLVAATAFVMGVTAPVAK